MPLSLLLFRQVSAFDCDQDRMKYTFSSSVDDHFAIDANTGQISLVKSLDRESVHEVQLQVWATDNGTIDQKQNSHEF